MPSEFTISREEVLAGLPAERARSILFAIESLVANLAARSRQAMERVKTEGAARARDAAFVAAFARGAAPPLKPTVQRLEAFAAQWADLVPENPAIRAEIARAIGEKYQLVYARVPGIRSALGLDSTPVRQAYERLARQPIDSLYRSRSSLANRLRWMYAGFGQRIEGLSPFWTAFSLTLTETVGATILALPIAMAGIGPGAAVIILVVLGLANVITIIYMAEASIRSGSIRYGEAFISRVVGEYLGSVGSLVFNLSTVAICVLALSSYYIGVSTTLATATRIPASVWVIGLLLVGLYFASRDSLNATVASALLIGAVNIGLLVLIGLLTVPHVRADFVLRFDFPGIAGRPFEWTFIHLIFGIVMTAYFGHVSVSNCARVVLRRDPSGRALTWGCIAAMGVAIVLNCMWIILVNGSLPRESLLGLSGTVLVPLSEQVGPLILALGVMFTALAMGMASVHFVIGLVNLTRDWLPGAGDAAEQDEDEDGLRLEALVTLPDAERAVLNCLIRRQSASLGEIAEHVQQGEAATGQLLDELVQRGWIAAVAESSTTEPVYRVRLARRRGTRLPATAWAALAMLIGTPRSSVRRRWSRLGETVRSMLSSRLAHTLVPYLPLLVFIVVLEWLLITERASFAGTLKIIGALVVPILGGVFPVLLLISSRRRGELLPRTVYRVLGQPWVLALIYLLFLGSVILHALFFYQTPMPRLLAGGVGVLVIGMTVAMVRAKVFRPRAILEFRQHDVPDAPLHFNVLYAGEPVQASLVFTSAGSGEAQAVTGASGSGPPLATLQRIEVDPPEGPARELLLWLHRHDGDQRGSGIAARIVASAAGTDADYRTTAANGQCVIPLAAGPCRVKIELNRTPGGTP